MIRENEKVFEVLGNGNRYRVLAQNITINGGGDFAPLSDNTPARISNCKVLQNAQGVLLGSGFERCNNKIQVPLKTLLEMSGGTWEQFALNWAVKMTEVKELGEE